MTDPDFVANLGGQLAPAQGDVVLGKLLLLFIQGDWGALGSVAAEFLRSHATPPSLWLGVLACLVLAAITPHSLAHAARFFAAVYCLCFLVHFLYLKHFVLSYRAIYQAMLYLALALLAEALLAALAERLGRPTCIRVLRLAGIMVLVILSVATMSRFRDRLMGRPLPFARLKGALTYALLESGARPGDRVFVPSPFGFHLPRSLDVVAHPAPKYFRGRWSPAFRDALRDIWGSETIGRVNAQSLCYAMGLVFIRPTWIVSWDGDYSTMQPFYRVLRKFPDIPGMQIERARKAKLPARIPGPCGSTA